MVQVEKDPTLTVWVLDSISRILGAGRRGQMARLLLRV